ncbi:MAG: glycoside hydrolase [Gammaproteobacteria bacterium]|nr:glycoside hydrolase [Gammaproteobacteria bacterium]
MNKKLFLLLGLSLCLQTGCTSKSGSETVSVSTPSQNAPAQVKMAMKHRLPEGVISVDITNNNNRLHLLTGQQTHGQKSLWYQYSDDDGSTWSNAARILDADNLQAKINRGNDARIAAQGDTVVVTWMKRVEGARFNAGPMVAARSTDAGKTWQRSTTPPDWITGPHGYVEMEADDNAIHAVWLDSRDGPSELKAVQGLRYARSTDGGQTWLTNKTLDNITCSCCWNTLKTDNQGNVYTLYRDKQPSDLALGVVDRAQNWQQLSKVGAFNWDFEGCPHIGGGLDIQQVGNGHKLHAVVGTGHQDYLGIHYLNSSDHGQTWTNPLQFGDESALHADVAAHDAGRVVATWDMMTDSGMAVFSAESADQGLSWSQPQQLSANGLRATHPRVIKTKSGFFIAWTEHNGKQQALGTRRL